MGLGIIFRRFFSANERSGPQHLAQQNTRNQGRAGACGEADQTEKDKIVLRGGGIERCFSLDSPENMKKTCHSEASTLSWTQWATSLAELHHDKASYYTGGLQFSKHRSSNFRPPTCPPSESYERIKKWVGA